MAVKVWNAHTIRKQRTKPNVPSGRTPNWYMRNVPQGSYDMGLPLNPELVDQLREPVADWGKRYLALILFSSYLLDIGANVSSPADPEHYLPAKTKKWCENWVDVTYSVPLDSLRPGVENPITGEKLHKDVYRHLRAAVFAHMESSAEPKLGLLVAPRGAYNWKHDQEDIEQQLKAAADDASHERVAAMVSALGDEENGGEDFEEAGDGA